MKTEPIFRKFFLLALVGTLFFYASTSFAPVEQTKEEQGGVAELTYYDVTSVTDGDTFIVSVDGRSETVRVLGVDTPETEHSSRGEECFGAEASTEAQRLLENMSVQLIADDTQADRDVYDRLLRYVTLPDGHDFGEVMVREGFAREYTFKGISYQKQQTYQAMEALAREESAGLWSCR